MEFYSREIQIMRQSQSKLALEYVQSVGVTVTVEELHRITDVFVETCLRPMDDDLKKRIKSLDKWLQEKKEINGN
jgi:phosphopantetheine adenylyltransferase